MRGVLIAITTSLVFATSQAQTISYYPADPDHIFLWNDAKPNETVAVKRVKGQWEISNTFLEDPVWVAELARIAEPGTPSDQAIVRALNQLMAGRVATSIAKLRLPNAHAIFVTQGESRILFIGSSPNHHFEVAFTKGAATWSKSSGIALNTWLGVSSDDDGARILALALGDVQPPQANRWTDFWNAVAVSGTAAGRGYRVATYSDPDGRHTRWLLIESGSTVQMLFDRVRKPLPPVPLPAQQPLPSALGGSGEPQPGKTDIGRAIMPFVYMFIAFGIGAATMWLVNRFVKRIDHGNTEASATILQIGEYDVTRFATALRPAILEALQQPSEASATALEPKLKALIDACNESAKTARALGDLTCQPQKSLAVLDMLPDRIRNAARAVVQVEKALTTANTTIQQQAQWKADLETAQREKKKLESQIDGWKPEIEKVQKLVAEVAGLRTEVQTANEKLHAVTKQNADKDVRIANLTADRQRELQAVNEELQKIRGAFADLGGLADRFQEGQKNHYSSRQDGPAASMLGFLANHSLQQLAVGIGTQQAEQRRYMLLNLEKIARSLPGLQGYQRALQELETKFDRQRAPSEADVKRAELRGEAPMFQFALRYLRESVNVDLAPYFFYVDENGSPYRAA